MTPMQILKNNLTLLSENLKNFDEANLNKSKAKSTYVQNVDDEYELSFPDEDENFSHFIKKEVKSDFVKIYKTKTKQEKYSIGFHFKYISVTEPTIQCSIKEGDNFSMSAEMNLVEFKEKLNDLNNQLVSKSKDTTEIVEKIKETFLGSTLKKKLKL